jgi:glycolate oxidase iron-sulfur subunit
LEACPTFTETYDERNSPRGRIYLVRSAVEGKLNWDDEVAKPLSQCLGCLACETACPSGVEYGAILEMARDHLAKRRGEFGKLAVLKVATSPALMKAQTIAAGRRMPALISKALFGAESEADLPAPQKPLSLAAPSESWLPPIHGEVYLLEGCAMRVLFPRVHQATRRLLRRVGYRVREVDQGCCGALHAHNGELEEAHRMVGKLAEAFAENLPVVVNSAGCGSTLKACEKRSLASRTVDLSEFLLSAGLADSLAKHGRLDVNATYHDACHLAHGQRIRSEPRELLRAIPGLRLAELPEADTCCGSAGIYNVLQPKMARRLLERKWANIAATRATVVVLGNPGCHAWIAQAARERGDAVKVLHTAELLEAAFSGDQAADWLR